MTFHICTPRILGKARGSRLRGTGFRSESEIVEPVPLSQGIVKLSNNDGKW
jgi:hypothetical protein